MKEEGIEMYPALKDKFVTIYNAFDTATIAKKAEEPVNSLLINRPYILAVQRLEESQKDLSTLIRAYKILVDKYAIKEDLYVIGEGKSRTDLQNLCQRLNIIDRVVFLKKQINPYPWMKHCRTFVLSSKFEGFGIVLIEAMALNCPIVSSNCPTDRKRYWHSARQELWCPLAMNKLWPPPLSVPSPILNTVRS